MKIWALIGVFLLSTVVPLHHAEAEKAQKRKVVVIQFSEADLNKSREPASVEEKAEQEAEMRHVARMSNIEWNLVEIQ